jgi:cytidylate kinase
MSTPPKGIRIITVSGRIAAGSTSLAKGLAREFGWKHIEGGEIFWEAYRKQLDIAPKDTNLRPDEMDVLFDQQLKQILEKDEGIVLESKLSGFMSQGIEGVFKIGVVCEDKHGEDQTGVRIDRLVNREAVSVQSAKEEVLERETHDLAKWRKLYANGNIEWVYWDKKYYDYMVNTFFYSQQECVVLTLEKLNTV